MGRHSGPGGGGKSQAHSPTIQIDHYRKQLGNREKKIERIQSKETKQKKAEKSKKKEFNTYLVALAVSLFFLFIAYIVVYYYNNQL